MKFGSEKTFGAGYNVLPVWKKRLDAKTLVTTPNSDVIYAMSYVDLGETGPLVFEAPQGLQGILMARKDQFVEAFTERLLTYGLARGVEAYDMPAVRQVRYGAARDNYRMQSIILGIVQSVPFVMRRTTDT